MDQTDDMRSVRNRLLNRRRACRCRWVQFPRPHLCAESRCREHAFAEAQYDGDVSIPRLAVQLRLF